MVNSSSVANLPDEALISVSVVALLLGQCRATVWRRMAQDPTFPRPIKLGSGCTRLRLGDVRAFIAQRAAQSAREARK